MNKNLNSNIVATAKEINKIEKKIVRLMNKGTQGAFIDACELRLKADVLRFTLSHLLRSVHTSK